MRKVGIQGNGEPGRAQLERCRPYQSVRSLSLARPVIGAIAIPMSDRDEVPARATRTIGDIETRPFPTSPSDASEVLLVAR